MKNSSKNYTKEERCPIMCNGKVIGHAIIRATYINDKVVDYKLIHVSLVPLKIK
jgi:hypothetical protein